MRRTCIVGVAAFLLLLMPVGTLSAAVGVRDYLPSRSAPAILPVDSVVGRLVEVSSDPLLERCVEAFSQPWSAQWVATYVEPSVRSMFTHTWDAMMVEQLPVSCLLCSAPVGDASTKTVAVRFFHSQDGASSAYSLIWSLSETDGQWYLIAMSVL